MPDTNTVTECPDCGLLKPRVKRRRQSTMYVDDEKNFVVCCRDCYDEREEHWRDAWAEYYAGRF